MNDKFLSLFSSSLPSLCDSNVLISLVEGDETIHSLHESQVHQHNLRLKRGGKISKFFITVALISASNLQRAISIPLREGLYRAAALSPFL